jgi:uncharacterized membrane protein SpoIIM required for sporulation/uncharacterized RDD family membrane protein YckC
MAVVAAHSVPVSATAAPLDAVREFPTPEHIAFEFRLAGPSARAGAWAIDLLIRGGVFIACVVPIRLLGAELGQGLILLIWFVLDWLSGGLCEWLWHGQTPGKRAMGIKVAGVDGLPAGLGACLLRNILRWADGLPFVVVLGSLMLPSFAIGLVAMVCSPAFQRLGDLAAGTLVVYTDRRLPPRSALPQEGPAAELARLLPPEVATVVDGHAARAIAAYVARRRQFHAQRRAEMAEHLAAPLRRRLGLPPRTEADTLLVAVHLALFPPQPDPKAPVAAGQGLGGKAAAILAKRRPDWLRLEGMIAGERVAGQPPQGAELSRLYRAACADLALAPACHLPQPNVTYLHGLVAQAHLRFYRRRAGSWRRLADLLLVQVPGRLYGDACLRVALIAFYGVFIASTLLGLARPDLVERFVGEESLAQMRDMYADAPHGRDTVEGAAMGGFYIHHNVGIALACFASGIFAGVGSLVWLAFNGLYLGLIFGFMAGTGGSTRDHFFEFVSAHGPFELTGIALAGAAGLRLGLGMVVTRGLPRLDSLRRASGEALPILAAAAVLVAAAAPIEAFVSPSALPLYAKRTLMGLAAGLVLLYLVGLGGRGRRILAARDAMGSVDGDDVGEAAPAGGPAAARP